MTTKDIKTGEIFLLKGDFYRCTSNDGFIFTAVCTDPNSNAIDLCFFGGEEDCIKIIEKTYHGNIIKSTMCGTERISLYETKKESKEFVETFKKWIATNDETIREKWIELVEKQELAFDSEVDSYEYGKLSNGLYYIVNDDYCYYFKLTEKYVDRF